ncbi:hypothetical protein CWI38_1876p0030 [Hamiltosporidium tvaerminnensis]|uniref:Uncharacterized protein n=1 Tax=Hamiltosporidium tvaerminnensis TaxID=1176355 RepID=A0A4Q9LPD7_9MICR|nr:hypothetical protein CWI38_1876p0030 [Hamiltosporidium tvaerminnensis]
MFLFINLSLQINWKSTLQKFIENECQIRNNRPDIFILDKKKNRITLIEYDLLANEFGLIFMFGVEIIPYSQPKRLQIPHNVEAYIQSRVVKRHSKQFPVLEPTMNINEVSDLEKIKW